MSKGPYIVKVLDADGCTMGSNEVDTLAQARLDARLAAEETDYLEAGMFKVEVRDASGECVFDRFVPVQA